MPKKSTPKPKAAIQDIEKVDAYLAKVTPEARATLEKLRGQIRRSAPDAIEGMSYGVPAFKYAGRPLVCYAAFKNHCGFYPMSPEVIAELADDLEDYETAKGTIRFPIDKPLSSALVKKVVKARIAELQKGGK